MSSTPEHRIAKTLADAIAQAGFVVTEIAISDSAARELSRELYEMQSVPAVGPDFFYLQLKDGKHRFMDVPVVVAKE